MRPGIGWNAYCTHTGWPWITSGPAFFQGDVVHWLHMYNTLARRPHLRVLGNPHTLISSNLVTHMVSYTAANLLCICEWHLRIFVAVDLQYRNLYSWSLSSVNHVTTSIIHPQLTDPQVWTKCLNQICLNQIWSNRAGCVTDVAMCLQGDSEGGTIVSCCHASM